MSAFVLVIVTALPVSGSVCALLCESQSNATAGHQGSAKDCDEAATSPIGVQIGGVSEHDCSSDDTAIREASLTAAEKANASVTSIPLVANVVTVRLSAPLHARAHFQNSSPPGTAPPTATPLVRRI